VNASAVTQPLRLATAAMGTRFELVLCAPAADARAIGEAALEEIELWHRRLTWFAPDSLVSHINRTAAAAPVRLDRQTWVLFRDALMVCARSDGAFDIAIGERTRARRMGAHDDAPATTAGAGAIELDAAACTIRFRAPGVSLDLGGIAKGHAVECAAAVLRAHGVTAALLHGGTSSVAAMGAPPDAAGWKVALARVPDAPVVTLRDETLSVSWPSSQQTGPDGSGHIIDPRTGSTAADTVVAVIGPDARLGDAWATAISVLGRRPDALPAAWTTCIARPGARPVWAGPASPGSS
jgi:FAD:protein FMN transferase